MAVRVPRTVKAATSLLERFAEADGQIAAIEARRRAALARINATYDKKAAALVEEHAELAERLKAWWPGAAAELTKGQRKSIALGGCEIGSRSTPASLGIAGDQVKIAEALQKKPWAGELVRTTVSIDRAAVLKSIDGTYAKDLKKLGFSKVAGSDTVFVKRVAQGGTMGAAAAR